MKNLAILRKDIDECEWTEDFGGKQDLDMEILSISSRYYPHSNVVYVAFYIGDDNVPLDDWYLLQDEIYGKNEEECKIKAKKWYRDNLRKAIKLLLDE